MAKASLDANTVADAMRSLVMAAQALNSAAKAFREDAGLSVQIFVNGQEYGDRVGVRIDGDLLDAYDEAR